MGEAPRREAVVAAVLNAASSPPFMTAHRIVVVREAGGLTAADAEVIGRYLDAPLDTSVIVLRQRRGHDPRRAHEEAEGGRRRRAGTGQREDE